MTFSWPGSFYFQQSDVLFCFIRNVFPFHLFRFLLLCMWKQKESLYKTIRRKAVILMKITQLRTDERTGGCKIVSHEDKLVNVLAIFVSLIF